jgi:hypothetical protein
MALAAVAWGEPLPRILEGPAFVEAKTLSKPDAWIKQPIRHPDSVKQADVAVTLDQNLYPTVKKIVEQIAAHQKWRVWVNEGTCGISEGLINRKAVDVAGYCCPPGPSDRLPGLTFHTLGIGALVLLVHPDNPISDITLAQARAIFSGKLTNWNQLLTPEGKPGPDQWIRPVIRPHCPARPGHWRLLVDNEDIFAKRAHEVGSIKDVFLGIRDYTGAIGYEAWNNVELSTIPVKALRVDGADPADLASLRTGRYPLYRVYNMSLWEGEGVANPKARALVEGVKAAIPALSDTIRLVPEAALRTAGWRFSGAELTGTIPGVPQ